MADERTSKVRATRELDPTKLSPSLFSLFPPVHFISSDIKIGTKYHQFVCEMIKNAKDSKQLKNALGKVLKAIAKNPDILRGDGL